MILIQSCRHSNNNVNKTTQPEKLPGKTAVNSNEEAYGNINQIVFGRYCGECGNHCATMYRYSMEGNRNSFSADFTDDYFKRKKEITFNTYLNDKFHLDIGNEIVSNIPDTILKSDKSSERFGCPDCADGCGIYFELTKDNKKHQFYIDYQTSQLTGKIKPFAEFLREKIDQLNKKNGL